MKIKRVFNRLGSEEKGSVMVLMALMIVVLLGSASLVIDGGLMYMNSEKVATAADAAALAGAQALVQGNTQAEAAALAYAAKNGVSNLTVTIGNDNKHLEVRAERSIDLHLARVLGINKSTAAAVSKAVIEPISGFRGIAPLGIPEQEFVEGQEYILKYASNSDSYSPSNMGILALGKPGASAYLHNLKYGFDTMVSIGETFDIQTGNISGDTYKGIQYRLDECKHIPTCQPIKGQFHEDCSRILIIPVIHYIDNQNVQVVGLKPFFVEAVQGMGNDNFIVGHFFDFDFAVGGMGSASAPDSGLYVPRLIP